MCKKHLEYVTRTAQCPPSPVKCALILSFTADVFKKYLKCERFKEWLHYHYVAWYHRHIPGFQVCVASERSGKGECWRRPRCGFSSCSFCVPLPPWGRSIWGCSQYQAGPAAASDWRQKLCWDGNDSGCRGGMPQPFPALRRHPARPTAAAQETWRGSGSGGGSWEGRGEKNVNESKMLYERFEKRMYKYGSQNQESKSEMLLLLSFSCFSIMLANCHDLTGIHP